MKRLLGLALMAGAASVATTTAAHAEPTFSGNVALTTDYVFRGISLTDGDPAIQGGFDYTNGIFYAGLWGSSLLSGTELDVYAGVTPTLGPVSLDLAIIGYFYPGAEDDDAGAGIAEFDYYELKAGASISPVEPLSLGGAVFFSPENYGETGEAIYLELNGSYAFSDALAVSAAYGNQSIDDPDGPFLAGTGEDDYNTWNLGVSYAMYGFGLDLRYHDTDIDAGDDIAAYTLNATDYDAAYVFTLSREL